MNKFNQSEENTFSYYNV